jgi:epoxide hydrolase-like predicted phosphatase
MTIRAVIWDFGGVILRMVDETPRQRLAERLGVNLQTLYRLVFDSESAQRCALGEISIEQHWATLGRILKVSPGDLAAVIDQFWAADDIDQELIDYIASLRPAYTLGLLSNACSDLRSLLSNRWKVAPLFDDLVISAEVGLVKPDPRIYHLALERLKVGAVETVFFDDNPENIQAARRVGLHAFVFTGPEQARQNLAATVEAQGGLPF